MHESHVMTYLRKHSCKAVCISHPLGSPPDHRLQGHPLHPPHLRHQARGMGDPWWEDTAPELVRWWSREEKHLSTALHTPLPGTVLGGCRGRVLSFLHCYEEKLSLRSVCLSHSFRAPRSKLTVKLTQHVLISHIYLQIGTDSLSLSGAFSGTINPVSFHPKIHSIKEENSFQIMWRRLRERVHNELKMVVPLEMDDLVYFQLFCTENP